MSEKEIRRIEEELPKEELFGRFRNLVDRYGEKKMVAFNGSGGGLGRKLIRWETPEVEIEVNPEVFKIEVFKIMVFTKSVLKKETEPSTIYVSLKRKDGNLLQLLTLNKEGRFSITNYCGLSPYVSLSQYGKLCDFLEKELARREVRKGE
jgi:hypothetical protein